MTTEFKAKCVTLAREIQEAMETLEIALTSGSEDRERVEAKNVVANVLRSHKALIDSLPDEEKPEAQKLFHKKIEDMAHKAKDLK